MATPPFSTQFVTDLAGETAWRFEAVIGPVHTPRAFCCDSPNDGVNAEGKEPVAGFTLSPNPATVGETISYDGTTPTYSYDPDGSVTGWAWTFESHTPSTGTAIAGTLNYGTVAGTFTIQLIVTDGTGVASLPARTELVIRQPTFDAYTASSLGVFYGSAANGAIAWTEKNEGLDSDLPAYDVVIDPATQSNAEDEKTLWRPGDGKVFVSNDGGATWTEKSPASVSNQWSDAVAPTVANLTFQSLLFADDKLFLAATWQNADSDYRSWVWYTTDFAAMRTDTSQTVTWAEVTTGWHS